MTRNSRAQSNPVACSKVRAECKNLHADLLSARCTVDRLRLQYGSQAVAECTERFELERLAANLLVIVTFVQSVEKALAGSLAPTSYDEDQASDSSASS